MPQHAPVAQAARPACRLTACATLVVANFVEAYGMKRYPGDMVRYLTYSLASCDETKSHLEILHESGSLAPERFEYFHGQYRRLGAMLYSFREAAIQGRI